MNSLIRHTGQRVSRSTSRFAGPFCFRPPQAEVDGDTRCAEIRWVDASPKRPDSAATSKSVPDCSARPFSDAPGERRKTYGKMGLITDQTRRSEYGGFAACVTSHEYLRRSAALRRSRGTEFRISVPYVCPTDASCRCWQPPLVFKPVVWPARSR
jgi:hypothetical protein